MTPRTSGFLLAAAVTVLFNTALAWAKDAYAPLNVWMKALTGHHWITHGLTDLMLFLFLGLLFWKTNLAKNMRPDRQIGALVGAVAVASFGLIIWYAFF